MHHSASSLDTFLNNFKFLLDLQKNINNFLKAGFNQVGFCSLSTLSSHISNKILHL